MSARDLTRADLVRVLGNIAARPAVDQAVRARADGLAARVTEVDPAATVRVIRQGPGDYLVAVSAPGLFAREFGGLDAPADPLIGPAIARLGLTEPGS
jgi:hypothetical protein